MARSAAWSASSPACSASDRKGGQPAPNDTKPSDAKQDSKDGKDNAKSAKAPRERKPPSTPAVLTQEGAPQLTAEQIVANSDANIDRIKAELNLTPEQEKNWTALQQRDALSRP